jgi:leucyl-tRNA synthetase
VSNITTALSETYSLNVAVAELMKLSNSITAAQTEGAPQSQIETSIRALVLCLAPMAPHFAAEAWHRVALASKAGSSPLSGDVRNTDIHTQQWPKADPTLMLSAQRTLVVQVMGVKKCTVQVPAEAVTQQAQEAVVAAVDEGLLALGHTICFDGFITAGPLVGLDTKQIVRTVVALRGKAPILNYVLAKPPKQ